MSLEIGHLTLQPTAPMPMAPAVTPAARLAPSAPAAIVDRSDVIPASPPPEVLAEVDAAWERAEQLAVEHRELHFALDERSGRVIIQVRTLAGEVLRTIPPSKSLDIMSGGEL